jgi:hypothetical protein
MKARWVVLLLAGGVCRWASAGIVLEEHSGYYDPNDPNQRDVTWRYMDPNDPNSPLAPDITIKYTDETHAW